MNKLAAAMVFAGGLAVGGISACTEGSSADNTATNVRDRSDAALTSGDQGTTPGDIKITQEIRKAITADKDLSTNAHNVKIITDNGIVTLRGPVKSAQEKSSIGAKAETAAGVTRVDNQIDIAS